MNKSQKITAILIATFFIFVAKPTFAQESKTETIKDFESAITINADSSMVVSETIKVYASGQEIKRGIYRDFPLVYQDKYGNKIKVDFKILEIKKDGQAEPYHTENLSNGIRIYIGNKDVYLTPGEYTYEIIYKTSRQLGFFEDHDELYWNVTGNGWVFPIYHAQATVKLPEGVPQDKIQLDGFSGAFGSTQKNFSAKIENNIITFETTKGLSAQEGLTIVVGWPKGFVSEPKAEEKTLWFFKDNIGSFVAGLGLLYILFYFFMTWNKVGRDPQKQAIIPQYDPPKGMSPALVGYIHKMGFSQKLIGSAIISLAIKKFLLIDKKIKYYDLTKISENKIPASIEENLMAEKLFSKKDTLKIENTNHSQISSAISALKKSLAAQAKGKYFNTNFGKMAIGLTISVAIILISLILLEGDKRAAGLFFSAWLSIWTFGVCFIILAILKLWKNFWEEKKIKNLFGAIISTALVSPFFLFEIFGLVFFTANISYIHVGLIFIIILTDVIFYFLLKAPTVEGRKIMDEIEGFKWFLSVTEKDRMNFHNPPEKTPELFEKFLAFALALGVENKWAEQFNDVFSKLKEEGNEYSPTWYHGKFNSLSAAGLATSLGQSLASAVSSSSTAPGSSSGFSGGSSGGGGGGGGGGGW